MALLIGLMSGTSIDGIDAALVDISGKAPHLKIQLRSWLISPFPKGFRKKILTVHTVEDVCRLNFELGELFSKAALALCRKAKISPQKIAAIGSHGQTICHLGREGTLQIGEPAVIAERTGITTVADFRPRDIAAHGFGAPLAPYLHYVLFRDPKKARAAHNLGGISNLTYIPKNADLDQVIGFDTGPGNMVIDGLLRELTDEKIHYDHGGSMAARGIVSLKLLKQLLEHPFFYQKPPKTAGREEFGRDYVKKFLKKAHMFHLTPQDLVATATALTASSLAENYRRFVFPKGLPQEIIFGGGGVHNKTLMKMIRSELSGVRISTFDDYGISSDAFEAVCFAVLAYATLEGVPSNITSVTGAKHPVVLGKIIPGKITSPTPSYFKRRN